MPEIIVHLIIGLAVGTFCGVTINEIPGSSPALSVGIGMLACIIITCFLLTLMYIRKRT